MHFLFYYYFSKIFTFFLKKDLNIVKINIIITLTKDEGVYKNENNKKHIL